MNVSVPGVGAVTATDSVMPTGMRNWNPTRGSRCSSPFKSDEDRQGAVHLDLVVAALPGRGGDLVYEYPIGQLIDHAEMLPEGTPPIRELIFSAPKEYLDTRPRRS